ncbi:DUF4377 domain-containing protein, partial [Bordetella pertussis]|uniref:DUF4377 domain-containing protein n=1 Tax=Bordetella pertussis TaxID=520 RepID=UPI003CC8ACA7
PRPIGSWPAGPAPAARCGRFRMAAPARRRADPLAGGQPGAAKLVYVASSKAPCSAGAGRAQCYQVRDSASQPWLLWYGDITGFAFQPGIEYRLRVVEVRDPNPPADASGVRWVLDSVVEQRVAAPRPAPAP